MPVTMTDLLKRAHTHLGQHGYHNTPPMLVSEEEAREMAEANCEALGSNCPPDHFEACMESMRGLGVRVFGVTIRIGSQAVA